MPHIIVKLENCAVTSSTRNKKINITKNNMLWAMIYANKMHREFNNVNDLREYIQWRKTQMDFVFDFSNSDLRINGYILKLEKTYLSTLGFDLGMILANIICKNTLGLNHLYHLNSGKYTYNLGSNVDYISQNSTGYFAIEAKGTIGEYWYGKAKALEQLSKVARINGKVPFKYAVLTRCKNLVIESRLIDPQNENSDSIQIPEEFWNYQNEIYELLTNQCKTSHGAKMKYIKIEGAFFGMISPGDRWGLLDVRNSEEHRMEIDNKIYSVEYFEDGSIIGIEETD